VFNNRLLVIDLSATQDEGDIGAAKVEDGYGLDDGTSLALDVLPIVGSAKSAIQLMSGKDLVTGEKVNRWLEAVGIVVGLAPGGKAALKAAAGGATALKKGDKIEGSTKAVNTGKKADDTVVGVGGKNTEKEIGNQKYTIDEQGRTVKAEGVIDGSHKGRKKKYVPEPAGGRDVGDHRGHMIPEGGVDDVKSVNIKPNVVSESPQSNLGLKKKFDLKASRTKDQFPESKVTTKHTPHYKGNDTRPHAVTHTLKKDGTTIESLSVLNPKKK